ncbi:MULTISPECIES: hypothetical protein [Sphingobacterium]|uniref:hypothetical protein n=1 Tax=Sphingobacterium TaxID=28453 RepID=UPI0013DADD34|nr:MULTISPECIES: hypothetical protein [unclassified Sphingobacterium]
MFTYSLYITVKQQSHLNMTTKLGERSDSNKISRRDKRKIRERNKRSVSSKISRRIVDTMMSRPKLTERNSKIERITHKIFDFVNTYVSGFAGRG